MYISLRQRSILQKGVIPMRVSRGLEYAVSKSGVAILRSIGNCTDEHIVVPSAVEGYPVVGVAEKAFARSTHIKSVTLPASVRFIEAQAFAWCRELTYVKLTSTHEIGTRAFMGCDKLSWVDLGNALEEIGEKAFAYCPALSNVDLPDTVSRLCSAAFEGCRNLCTASLSRSLKIIENSTFYACESLRRVELPSKLEYIDECAFAYCSSLVDMDVPAKTVINNQAFFECRSIAYEVRVS